MKRKLLIGGIVGVVVLGGAIGAAAATGPNTNDSSNQTASLTEDKVTKIVTDKVDGTVEKIEKETDDGRLIFEVDVKDKNGVKTDVGVDAKTGEVLEVDQNDDRDDDSEKEDSNENVKLSMDEATAVAKEKAKGEVVESELDDGHYDFEFKDGNDEYEVKVHGASGEVIEFEHDQDNE
ncbi:PepSY domain-containing protein [Halobacillus shinanisalinarum]|uniref:PepSY domain-containing protein n=1 Tax=Halobacillus shinanisalinarum TaxID=2932258 RepID=A0ABY4H313_9BACI|nr:PepSY domain-containing protein [Halobacillus shinanisalinarum]UOQ94295.1 PepSY domain-containing protein [Halobacillus shinanisalinarum]